MYFISKCIYNVGLDNNGRKFEYLVYPDIKLISSFTVQNISIDFLYTLFLFYLENIIWIIFSNI